MSRPLPKVLIIDEMHPSLLPLLQAAGFEFTYLPAIEARQVPAALANHQVLVVRSKLRVTKEFLQQTPQLRVIARAGAGLDNIDLDSVTQRGITVVHAAEGNRQAVAEHTLALLLNLLNNIQRADAEVRQSIWQREANRGTELAALTVAVIGYGHMGTALVQLLRAFGCRILVYDKYRQLKAEPGIELADLDRVYAEADVVSLHVPLTTETDKWFNYELISKFAKPIYLVNTARGEVAPLSGLVQGLKSGKLLGIGLDVLENEKLQQLSPSQHQLFSYLINSNRVVFTPHVAGWTHQSYQKINEVLVAKLRKVYGLPE